MNENQSWSGLSTEDLELVEQICTQFERSLKAGEPIPIESQLSLVGPHLIPFLLKDLISLELDYSAGSTDQPTIEHYLRRFPGHTDLIQDAFESNLPPTLADGELSEVKPASVSVGQSLPRLKGYEIIEQIGEGGMATVWRAVQTSTQREVAVKIMAAHTVGSDRARLRFEREIELAARLEHPNIARIYDSGLRDGVYFYVMELIDGQPLDEFVSDRTLDQHAIITLMHCVCESVQFAHQRGIVHRDIKPSNILVTEDGKPHLLDFGLAKASDHDDQVSMDGHVLGTPAYMSPEQAAGRISDLDTQTDVYSLGVTLFKLLTGHLPHSMSGSRDEVLHRIAHESAASPRRWLKSIDRELELLVETALAADRSRRYVSAAELARDLRNFLTGDPLLARAPSLTYILRKRIAKHRLAAGVVFAFVVLAAGLWGYSYLAIRSERDTANTERERAERLAIAAARERDATAAAERLATENARVAVQRETESRQRLIRSYVAQATRLTRSGDYAQSLGYAVEAAALARPDAESPPIEDDRIHRQRIALLLQYVGVPESIVHVSDARSFLGVSLSRDARYMPVHFTGAHALLSEWPIATERADGRHFSTVPVVRVIDLHTGRFVGRAIPNSRFVVQPALITPDGKHVVVKHSDKSVAIWDFRAGSRIGQLMDHEDSVTQLMLDRAGARLLTTTKNGHARVWDLANGQAVSPAIGPSFRPDHHVIYKSRLSPDGTRIATGVGTSVIRVHDAESGQPLGPAIEHEEHVLEDGRIIRFNNQPANTVHDVEFTADERLVLTCATGNRAQLWNVATGKPLGDEMPGDRAVMSPDGETVALIAQKKLGLWSLATGRQIGKDVTHEWNVQGAVFSPDGSHLAAWSTDGIARAWRTRTMKSASAKLKHLGNVVHMGFSSDGSHMVTLDSRGIARTWSPTAGAPNPKAFHHGTPKPFLHGDLSRDGTRVATVTEDHTAIVWDVETGTQIAGPFAHETQHINQVALSPDGRRLITVGRDKTARVWDVERPDTAAVVLDHEADVEFTTFSIDGRLFATASKDRVVRVWTTENAQPVGSPLPHRHVQGTVAVIGTGGSVKSARFTRDGKRLLTIDSIDARLWDVQSGHLLGILSNVVAMNSDGSKLFAFQDDSTTGRMWDVERGEFDPGTFDHAGAISSAAFDPEDERLLTVANDNTARMWDARTGEPLGPSVSVGSKPRNPVFDPTGRIAAISYFMPSGFQLFDTRTSEPISPSANYHKGLLPVVFSDDGSRILTISAAAYVTDIRPDSRSLPELRSLAELVSGHRVDQTGGLSKLSTDEWLDTWRNVRDQAPSMFPLDESKPTGESSGLSVQRAWERPRILSDESPVWTISDIEMKQRRYSVGQKVQLSYRIVPVDGNADSYVEDKLLTDFGTAQHWLERLGPHPSIAAKPPKIKRWWRRYAAGGFSLRNEQISAEGTRSFKREFSTENHPPGRYRYTIQLRYSATIERPAVVKSIEFELEAAE